MSGRILVVDDDEATCDLVEALLKRQEFSVAARTSAKSALELVSEDDFDVVLTDVGMSEMSGLELCERILGARPDMLVIVMTALGSLETAISAMRAGAFDFVTKPLDANLLGLTVSRAVQHRRLRAEVRRLREAAHDVQHTKGLVGRSPAMKRVYDLIGRVARSDASVLVHGETGTGKELIARAIHEASGRPGPFVAVNCAAVPQALLESELFGHARGAFTDAKTQRTGLFLEASGGTIFLDEIGEMPLEVQPKLLRALQERKVRPVGSNAEIPFDARIVTATNRDLETEVYEKRFREDLYYRVNVVKIDLPPLRERGTDVLHLAMHFLEKFSSRSGKGVLSLSTAAAEKLTAYNWPGNVRELENSIERAVALARFEQITVEDLPEKVQAYRPDRFVVAVDEPAEIMTMDELEKRYIKRVLALVGGNKSRAAQMLGFDRRTLYRKLERYGEQDGSGADEVPDKDKAASSPGSASSSLS
ncbi:Fis family transcriptional regulator [Sorangium cellulosum]|uniref:Fis family transcriptional regulator n=1 Tax=Sorangium cellulosum TaxID=56 RepID=A0A4P2QCI1_SORCE|nr:sigma-54 dependent transcriptional regulator [Sorangium cellulosum]AUX27359.1 Fis family transcriptional regulator [Sorangium cellulosum]